jgi:hypothetical protein
MPRQIVSVESVRSSQNIVISGPGGIAPSNEREYSATPHRIAQVETQSIRRGEGGVFNSNERPA